MEQRSARTPGTPMSSTADPITSTQFSAATYLRLRRPRDFCTLSENISAKPKCTTKAESQAGAGCPPASPRRLFCIKTNLQSEHGLEYQHCHPTCGLIRNARRSTCGFSRIEGSGPARDRCGNEAAFVLYQPCGQEAEPLKAAQPAEGSQVACGANRPRAAAEERSLTT